MRASSRRSSSLMKMDLLVEAFDLGESTVTDTILTLELASRRDEGEVGQRDGAQDSGPDALVPLLGKGNEGAGWSARHENLQKNSRMNGAGL